VSKPIILRKRGDSWEVLVDTRAARAFGAKRKSLEGLPVSGTVPIVRTGEKKIDLVPGPGAHPARFSKGEAEHVAHMLGRYKFGFGDHVYTYVEERRTEGDRTRHRRGCAHDCVGIHTHESLARHASRHAEDHHRLSAAERHRLRRTQFALPGREALPLHVPGGTLEENRRIVRSAASRLSGMRRRGTISESTYHKALARVRRAERRLGIHHRTRRGGH
jgi:hypothetical protein